MKKEERHHISPEKLEAQKNNFFMKIWNPLCRIVLIIWDYIKKLVNSLWLYTKKLFLQLKNKIKDKIKNHKNKSGK